MTSYCDCGWAMDGRLCSGCGLTQGECVCEKRARTSPLAMAVLASIMAGAGCVEQTEQTRDIGAPIMLRMPDSVELDNDNRIVEMGLDDFNLLRKQMTASNYWSRRADVELNDCLGLPQESPMPSCADVGCASARLTCDANGACECPGAPTVQCRLGM